MSNLLSSFLEVSPNFREFIEKYKLYDKLPKGNTNININVFGEELSCQSHKLFYDDKESFYQDLKKYLHKDYYFRMNDGGNGVYLITYIIFGSKKEIEDLTVEDYQKKIKISKDFLNIQQFIWHDKTFGAYLYNIKEDREIPLVLHHDWMLN